MYNCGFCVLCGLRLLVPQEFVFSLLDIEASRIEHSTKRCPSHPNPDEVSKSTDTDITAQIQELGKGKTI